MILYLDTSSLLKLYVEEAGTQEVQKRVENAEVVATSIIAYPEAHAALARRHREGALSRLEFKRVLSQFHDTWLQYLAITISTPLYTHAGSLAITYNLRGMDALHLASMVELLSEQDHVDFLSHDTKLSQAASKELKIHKP